MCTLIPLLFLAIQAIPLCLAALTTVTIGTKNIFMSSFVTDYHSVAGACEDENLEEFFPLDNAEFQALQNAISSSTYQYAIFWIKVEQVPKADSSIKYDWQTEEVVRSAWFHSSTAYLEPNGRGEGCDNDPHCCVRMSTRWGVGYSNEASTGSGLHELTDISCGIDASFFCATPVVTTEAPTTQPSTTQPPTTQPPTTEPPTTQPPTTQPPTTEPPTTQPPTTQPPTTQPPTTQPPTTQPPTTQPPTTQPPTTQPPTTQPPTTQPLTTQPPTTQPPTTQPPTTQPPTTQPPTTQPPTTQPPTTQPSVTNQATSASPQSACLDTSSLAPNSNNDSLSCACSPLVSVATLNDIQPVIEATRKYLAVHVPSLSSTKRRLKSAEDSRPSSIAMGSVAIVFMVFSYGVIVLFDLLNVFMEGKHCRYMPH